MRRFPRTPQITNAMDQEALVQRMGFLPFFACSIPTFSIIEFLGVWETLYNPNFNRVEFDAFRNQAGLNSFVSMLKRKIDFDRLFQKTL